MLSNIQHNIVIRALQVQENQGEGSADIPEGHKDLIDEKKAELLETLEE